jgi:DNA-binding response OmpR family regulator
MPVRILLVEDQRKVASFVARALRESAYAVDVAPTGERGLELARDSVYDAILLDVRLPGIDGVEVCRALRRFGVQTPVMMLTARTLVEQRVEGLDAGADDYLTKPFAVAELRARVRALVRRGSHSRDGMLRYADLELDCGRRRAKRGDAWMALAAREFALLELLLMRAPETVTRSEIIEHVWDVQFDSDSNLVEVYINKLRNKIDSGRGVALLHTVRGAGYRIGLPDEG